MTSCISLVGLALLIFAVPIRSAAQDDQDDPPTRVARLGYMEGSVSFQPAGEEEWVGAVDNRPLTTGDKLWADRDSRAELQLGSAVIRLSANTGISFLNLDDHTVQIQLSAGMIDVRVRRLDGDDDFEVDTPNLAFTATRPGRYRIIASEDGATTTIGIRQGGEGEATGGGQSYDMESEERGVFTGTEPLNADVEPIGDPDQFDAWIDGRDHRWDNSRSAQYLSRDVVGFDDLDDNGDWRDDSNYGHVWFPHVEVGWAPYHTGHWAWIDPWGYTWVDDSSWGYAPFHYGRWVAVDGRWGWIAGPPAERPVYAPALVVFVGLGGGGIGADVGWFPLGPREVFVPSYPVSRTYMTQINVSNTTVNTTTVTNVYNTTIINKSTTITNVTYVNRTVPGAVTAVPKDAMASAQPVARVAVRVSPQQVASASVTPRVAVVPTKAAVLGAKASTAGHVTAPPPSVVNRPVVAKKAPPPPPVPFAQKQKILAEHPGQPVARKEMAALRPATAAHPMVKVAPPAKPATPSGHPVAARPGQPGAQPANRPGNQPAAKPAPAPAQPNRPGAQPANRPEPAQPNRPEPNRAEPNRPPAAQPAPNNRPEVNKPTEAPAHPPAAQPNNRPEPNRPPAEKPVPNNRPEMNRPTEAPAHPPAAQPNNRPETNRPPTAQPPANRPETNRPPAVQPKPEPNRSEPAARPSSPPPAQHPPAAARPAPPAAKPASPPAKKPETPEEKKKREEQQKPPGV